MAGLRRSVGYQLLGIITAGALVLLFADQLVRGGIALAAGYAAGAPVSIGAAQLDLPAGRLQLWDVVVSNPPGYSMSHFLWVRSCELEFNPLSLGGPALHIRRLSLEGVSLNIERNEGSNNAGQILARLVRSWSPGADGPRVLLERIELRDAAAHIAFAPGLGRTGRTGVLLQDTLFDADELSSGGLPATLLAHRALERLVDLALLRVIESGVYIVSTDLEAALRERLGPVRPLPLGDSTAAR